MPEPIAPRPDVVVDAAFWRTFLSAVETRPVGDQRVRGASGLEHSVVDVGVDDARNRIVIVTDSPDPKLCAFVQSDVQQLYREQKVVAVRAVLVDVRSMVRKVAASEILSSLSLSQLDEKPLSQEDIKRHLEPVVEALTGDPRLKGEKVGPASLQFLTQIVGLNWSAVKDFGERTMLGPLLEQLGAGEQNDIDQQLGICPIPIHDLSADDVEEMKASRTLDVARDLLRRHGVLEYFFPRAEELALGFIDRGIATAPALGRAVMSAPVHGHPLIDRQVPRVEELIDKLQTRGLVVEGELGFQTTVAGADARALVKFKPKESLLVKLKNLGVVRGLIKYFTKS